MSEFKIKLDKTITMAFSGNKFTGKSTLCKHFLKSFPRNLVYGPYTVEEFRAAGFNNLYISRTNSPDEFEEFCSKVLNVRDMMFVVDEAQNFMPGGPGSKLGPNALEVVMYGRHEKNGKPGIGLMVTTKRPALLNKAVLEEANYLFLFRHMIPNDIEYLLDIVGPDAWILQELKEHSFMIYDNTGGQYTGQFFGPYMLVGDKIVEYKDDSLKRDNAYVMRIGDECLTWLRKAGVKGTVTKANVDVFLKEKNLKVLPNTADSIYNYANTKSKVKR